MKANFLNNISRMRYDLRRYASKIWGLSLMWKIAIFLILLLMLPFILPVLQVGLTAVVPIVGTLFFMKDDFDGRKRGVISFVLGSVAQLFVLVMIFSLLPMGGIPGELGIATIVSATVSGLMMLIPGYAFAYLAYGLDHKESDGKIYLFMYGLLALVLTIWNAGAVIIS